MKMKRIILMLAILLTGTISFAQTTAKFESKRIEISNGKTYNIKSTIEVYKSKSGDKILKETLHPTNETAQIYTVEEEEHSEDGAYIVRVISKNGIRYAFIFRTNVVMMIALDYDITYIGELTYTNF